MSEKEKQCQGKTNIKSNKNPNQSKITMVWKYRGE